MNLKKTIILLMCFIIPLLILGFGIRGFIGKLNVILLLTYLRFTYYRLLPICESAKFLSRKKSELW